MRKNDRCRNDRSRFHCIWRVNGQLHGPATFLLLKEPPVQTEKRLGWPLIQSGNSEEHNLFPDSPALSLVTTLTDLAWCHIRLVCLGNSGRNWSWCKVKYMAVTMILLADNGGKVLPSSSRHWYYASNYRTKHVTQALILVHTCTHNACALHSTKTTQHKCHTETLPDLCIPDGPGPVGNKYNQSNMFVYARHSSHNPHSNTLATTWPPHWLCYRAHAVSYHLHLNVLSFPQGKVQCTFQ